MSDRTGYRCAAVHVAKAFRQKTNASIFEPACDVWDVRLQCNRLDGHEGPHRCTLPEEAGEDEGKTFEWPA